MRRLAVAATLGGCNISGRTTTTTAAAATLSGRTCSRLRGRAFLRLPGGCFRFIATFVIAFELVVIEVFAAVENDSGLMLGALRWSGRTLAALGAQRTLATVTITATAVATF